MQPERNTSITFRVPEKLADALDKAQEAEGDNSRASLINRVLTAWLRKGGYLK